MPSDLALKAFAFALFAAGMGASVYYAYGAVGSDPSELGRVALVARPGETATMGGEVVVPFTVTNTYASPQTVVVESEGAYAGEPVTVEVPANGKVDGTIRLTAPRAAPGDSTIALKAVFAGREVAASAPIRLVEGRLTLVLPLRELNLTAGGRYDLPVAVRASDGSAHAFDVTVADAEGLDGGSASGETSAERGAGVFVPIRVAAGASPGERVLAVTLEGSLTGAEETILVRIVPATGGLTSGGFGRFLYVGRYDDGTLFNTNDARIDALPEFARAESYSLSAALLPVTLGAKPNVVKGFAKGVNGTVTGEFRSFVVEPSEGYGNASVIEDLERESTIERDLAIPAAGELTRARFDQFVDATGQGPASKYKVGDSFTSNASGNAWPFAILSIDDREVVYRLDPRVGTTFTLYRFWPNASVVSAKNDTHVVMRTTPTTADAPFSFYDYWPVASVVSSLNDTHVVVRHSPKVGTSYRTTEASEAPEFTVVAVGAKITVSHPNPNPLAGRRLLFDVERVS